MARCNVRLETALRTQKSVLHVLNMSVGGAEKRVCEVRKFVQVWVQGSLFLKAVFLFYYPVKLFVCSLILSHSEIDGQISVLNIFPMSFKPFKILSFCPCGAFLHASLCIFLINANFVLIWFCYHIYFLKKVRYQMNGLMKASILPVFH